MKVTLASLIVLGGILHTGLAHAVDQTYEICELHVAGNAAEIVPCEGRLSSLNSCAKADYVAIDLARTGGALMYKTALAASVSGKPILVRIRAVAGDCVGDYDRTTVIRILNE